jgi:hypothetical protein
MVDKEEEAILKKEHADAEMEKAKEEMATQGDTQHQQQLEQIEAKKPPPKPAGA